MIHSLLIIAGAYFMCDPCRLLSYEIANHSVDIKNDIVDYMDKNVCNNSSTCKGVVGNMVPLFIDKFSDPTVCVELGLCGDDVGTIIEKISEHHLGEKMGTDISDIIKSKISVYDNYEFNSTL